VECIEPSKSFRDIAKHDRRGDVLTAQRHRGADARRCAASPGRHR
jgi:hypothetical protein